MVQVRVAISGPGGSGKTYIVRLVQKRLEDMGYRVAVIDSVMRQMTQIGYVGNQSGNWQSQMASAIVRQVRQRELASEDFDFILSDRAMSCVLGYTQLLLEESTEGISLFGDLRDREDFSNLLAARDMTKSLWSEDSINFWDQVFFKEIHPDFMPEDDGSGRVKDDNWHLDTQKRIQDAYLLHWGDFLHPDREEAAEQVYEACMSIMSRKDREQKQKGVAIDSSVLREGLYRSDSVVPQGKWEHS